MTCQAYLKKFQNSVKVIEHCGGDLGIDTGLIDATFAIANPAVTTMACLLARAEQHCPGAHCVLGVSIEV